MGLTTNYVKSCWREAKVDYPGPPIHGEENRIRKSVDGKIAVAYMDTDDGPVILTVLWQGDRFTRAENE